jgi:hypothetical protein
VSKTTFLVVETRTLVLVDVMTEMRGLSVEEEIATRLLTGVPFEQVTPLSF